MIGYLPWRTRERLANLAWKRMMRRPPYWIGLLFFASIQFAILVLIFVQMKWSNNNVMLLIIGGLQMASFPWFFLLLREMRKHYRAALHEAMLSERIRPRLCLKCGYDLQHQNSDRCPECGAAVSQSDTQTSAT